MKSVTWKIGGEAGFGIMSAGTILAKTLTRLGYHIFVTNEYPSLIRGGHNLITLRVADEPFHSMNKDVHILVALNAATVKLHKDELSDGAVVLYDPGDGEWKESDFPHKVHLVQLPMTAKLKELHADVVMRNTIAIGATVGLLGLPEDALGKVLSDMFLRKGQEVVDFNMKVAKIGWDIVRGEHGELTQYYLPQIDKKGDTLVLNGSEAFGVGAVKAGLKFAAIYPMTPINALITYLADHAKKYGIVYKQPEDEVSGINMALGASMMGVRSMVATSGGGYALMTEGTSLAGMQELPVVIDMGMRVGPATGMPTWTEQSELQFVIHAGHGEFPRIVLAPGDGHQCHDMAALAFELADKYQIPVFVLTDKYLNESHWAVSAEEFAKPASINRGKLVMGDTGNADFKRYDLHAEDGISPRSVPGTTNGVYYANSYEHDEKGFVTEVPEQRTAMVDKRTKKTLAIQKAAPAPTVYGDADAEHVIIGWGSTLGPVLDGLHLFKAAHPDQKVKFLHYTWVYPFPAQTTEELLKNAKTVINIENNSTGQLAALLREHTGIKVTHSVLQYSGRVFFPEEIAAKLAEIVR